MFTAPKYDPEKIHPELRKLIEEYDGAMLYFHINTAGGVSHRVRHNSMQPDRLQQTSIGEAATVASEMFQEQRFCMEQLQKKGIVKVPVDEDGQPTGEYWKWFKAWHTYVQGLPYEEWQRFEVALNAQEDVSEWYPEELKEE